MALVKCYDAEGNEFQKESVDVRECVAHCGFTLQPVQKSPEVVQIIEPIPEPVKVVKTAKPVPTLVEPEPEVEAVITPPWGSK